MKVGIDAIAYALPREVLTNETLRASHPDWDFDRLEERTGVLQRHISGPGETALDLAAASCDQLIGEGSLVIDEVDAVIFCTETPDYVIPPNACLLHGRLGMRPNVVAFDINMGCSGYIYGLELARSLIVSGAARKVLLATADTYSRLIHPDDRATRCLFGDGGAVSLISPSADERGLLDISLGTAGKYYERFIVRAGGARCARSAETATAVTDRSGNVRTAEHIKMDGLGVSSFFNSTIPATVRALLEQNGVKADDVDLFVFHQASRLALDSLRRLLDIPDDKMLYEIAEVGNLVSASIPVALKRAIADGRIQPGDLLLLCGFGVGLSWGTALLKLA